MEANYKGRGKWFPGKIRRVRADGSYDVDYDDGEVETALSADLVRAVGSAKKGLSPARGGRIEEGSKVEANYRGKGKYYPGRVKRDRGDGTYDIDYNDGEQEIRVPADMIRLLDDPGNDFGRKNSFSRGTKVEANYKGRGKWFPGIITFDRGDGTFDVDYNDGESEMKVDVVNLRVLKTDMDSREESKGSHSNSNKLRTKLVSKKLRATLNDILSKFQATSTDKTCSKIFEEFDENPPSGYVIRREFKVGLKKIFSAVKVKDSTMLEDVIDEADLSLIFDCLSTQKEGFVDYDCFIGYALDELNEEANLDDIHEKILKDIQKSKLRAKDVLKIFSTSKSFKNGYVRQTEFEKFVFKAFSKLSSDNLKSLSRRFDLTNEGVIDYSLFLRWAFAGADIKDLKNRVCYQLSLLSPASVEDALAGNVGKGNEGRLGQKDFVAALQELGLMLTSMEMKAMFAVLDSAEKKGTVSQAQVMDFISAASGNGKDRARLMKERGDGLDFMSSAIRDEARDSIQKILASSKTSVGRLIYQNADEKTGVISRRQLRKVLESLSIQLRESDENMLFEALGFTGESCVAVDDLLLYFMELASQNDSEEAFNAVKEVIVRKRVAAKEVTRLMLRSDSKGSGFLEHSTFEKIIVKLAGSSSNTFDAIADLKRFLDPKREGVVDLHYAAAIITASSDPSRCELKLRNIFRIMRIRNIDYKKHFMSSVEGSESDMQIDRENFINTVDSFNIPMLRSEIIAIADKHQRGGAINFKAIMDILEAEDPQNKSRNFFGATTKMSDSFGKGLFKKICKVRSNAERRNELRRGLIERDHEMVGFLAQRDFQRVIDHKMDLTDEEAALLAENLTFTDGSHRLDIDYSLLLLVMMDPINNSPMAAGTAVMSKMMRGNDIVSLRRLLSLLFRNCAAFDLKATGLAPYQEVEKVVKEECANIDAKQLKQVLTAFQESRQNDTVMYPELISYLGNCSLCNVMHRLNYVDGIRQKQGYQMKEFFVKYAEKKASKLDSSKFVDQLLSLGIVMAEVSIALIFSTYGLKNNTLLDAEKFVKAMKSFASEEGELEERIQRNEVSVFKNSGPCEISSKILADYDAKLMRALQIAFDLFDKNGSNEIPSVELERVLNSLGQSPSISELELLLSKIDPQNKGTIEYNNFISVVVPYLRSGYQNIAHRSVSNLKRTFDKFNDSGDGLLKRNEFKHLMRVTSSDISPEELNAMMEYLDVDDDGSISFEEFVRAFEVIGNDDIMDRMPVALRAAMRKLQYSALPDPEKHLTMFIGLPFNYRLSVLSELETLSPRHSLDYLVCNKTRMEKLERQHEMQFEVQILRVSGIPSEDALRRDDVVGRGVKFCVVKTDKPPALGQPGNSPEFLSNVTKVNAQLHQYHADKWVLSESEDGDPDKSCFVRCYNSDPYINYKDGKVTVSTSESTVSPVEQLHLFIELIVSFKVNKKHFKITDKGLKRKRKYEKLKTPQEKDSSEVKVGAGPHTTNLEKKKKHLSTSTKALMSTFSLRNKESASENNQDKNDATKKDEEENRKEASANAVEDSEVEADEADEEDSEQVDEVVDMCCGWAMIPIAATLRGALRLEQPSFLQSSNSS